jgi:hypothetical protein
LNYWLQGASTARKITQTGDEETIGMIDENKLGIETNNKLSHERLSGIDHLFKNGN